MSALGLAAVVAAVAGPLSAVGAYVRAATPSPSAPGDFDPSTITPGLPGFLVTFAVVLACIPLFLSMTRKVRGVQYRGRLAEDADTGTDADGTDRPGADPEGGPPGPGHPRA